MLGSCIVDRDRLPFSARLPTGNLRRCRIITFGGVLIHDIWIIQEMQVESIGTDHRFKLLAAGDRAAQNVCLSSRRCISGLHSSHQVPCLGRLAINKPGGGGRGKDWENDINTAQQPQATGRGTANQPTNDHSKLSPGQD